MDFQIDVDPDDLGPFDFVYGDVPEHERNVLGADEIWVSGRYAVYVRRNSQTGWSVNNGQLMVTHLSVKRHDREAIHDWRDLQLIKNAVCGPEREALEIYPAESRLVDTSNQFHLWVLPEGIGLPLGFNDGRLVAEASLGKAKQRSFEVKPDNAVDPDKLEEMVAAFLDDHGADSQEVIEDV